MNELDQLLQDTLDAAADRVPMSQDAWIRNEQLLRAQRTHRNRAAIFLSTAAAAVVAVVVAVLIWAIPGQHGAPPATGDSRTPAPTASGTPPAAPHPSDAPSANPTNSSGPAAGTSAVTSPAIINENADDAVRSELLQAFTAYRSQPDHPKDMATIPPTAVEGLTPGKLFYAFVPSTDTYWAKATFQATAQAMQGNDYIGFQDGGATAIFSRTGDGAWTVRYVGSCDLQLPADVAQLWSLPSHTNDPLCN